MMSRNLRALVVLTAILGLVLGAAPPASAGLQGEPEAAPGELLVGFRSGTSSGDRAQARRSNDAPLIEVVFPGDRRSGAVERVSLPDGADRARYERRFEAHPDVAYAEPNWKLDVVETSNDPYYTSGSLWGMYGDATSPANQYGSQAGESWATGNVGSHSVWVGVIDQGIQHAHPDLDLNVGPHPGDPTFNGIDDDGNGYVDDVYGWDFYNDDNSVYDSKRHDEHGTHVAGTIGAEGGNGTGVAGVNWNVKILSGKFLGPMGGYTSDAVRAVDYFTNLKKAGLNVVATNNSWGGGGYAQTLYDAIGRARDAEVLFVAAAGNDGADTDTSPHYPSSYSLSNIISVAALTKTGSLASWSNFGDTTVDLAAPGSGIYSTVPDGYASFSGTSMAAPHVAGAAALYKAVNASATMTQIRDAIFASVVPTASVAGKTVTGGRLNVGGFVGSGSGDTGTTDTTDPIVSVTAPTDGSTVSGPQTVTASASDAGSGVASVQFSVDGTSIGTDTTSSDGWTASWDTTTATNDAHTVTAIATDVAGNTASHSVSVTVDNSGTVAGTVSVTAIGYATYGGKASDKHLLVTPSLKDGNGDPVAGASVSIRLDNTTSGGSWTATGSTGTDGTVGFELKNAPSGIYTTTMTGVTATGYEWDGVTPTNSYEK